MAGSPARLSRRDRLGRAGQQPHAVRVGEIAGVLDDGAVAVEKDRAPVTHSRKASRQSGGHRGEALLGEGARIEQHAVPRHAGDDRRIAQPEPEGQTVGPSAPAWSETSVVGSAAPGNEPPPTADSPGSSLGSSAGGQRAANLAARCRELGGVHRQHPQHRNRADRLVGVAVERQRRLEGRERHLVGPHRTGDRMLAASRDQTAAPDDAPGLRVRPAACPR